jgi:hypothetical protein
MCYVMTFVFIDVPYTFLFSLFVSTLQHFLKQIASNNRYVNYTTEYNIFTQIPCNLRKQHQNNNILVEWYKSDIISSVRLFNLINKSNVHTMQTREASDKVILL